jgi:hypothetical protein
MSCKVRWQTDFIDSTLSNNFRTTELRKHRENVLLDREKSLLPSTIPHVENEIKRREITKNIIELQKEKRSLSQKISDINLEISDLSLSLRSKIEIKENREFIRACPGENCRGFLSKQWKCDLCDTKVCAKCHEIKDLNHICNEDDLKTAALLKTDTKACPNCASLIYKIDGCNLMFCTECHVSFDWITGKIETKNLHNPHYYEWLRQQNNGIIPRNEGDNCVQPNYYNIQAHTQTYNLKIEVLNYIRIITHIENIEYPRYTVNNNEDVNRDLRIKYLLNEISQTTWKFEIQARERKNIKKNDIRLIFEMFCNVGNDLLRKILVSKKQKEINQIIKEFNELRNYFNQNIQNVLDRHKSKKKINLNDKWSFY